MPSPFSVLHTAQPAGARGGREAGPPDIGSWDNELAFPRERAVALWDAPEHGLRRMAEYEE